MIFKSTLLTLIFVLCGACGGSMADRTNKAIGTALVATDAARDQFVSWDKQHQLDIVDKAVTRAQAETGLKEYRDKRQRIIQAFTVAYSSMASAAAMVPLVQAGQKSDKDLAKMLVDAVGAVQSVIASVQEIRAAFEASPVEAAPPDKPSNPEPVKPTETAPASAPAAAAS